MAEYRAHDTEHDARAYRLLDEVFDQWLILADTFIKADPALANTALQALDERLDEFANEIDPMGWDHEWYEIGRQLFRRALIRRLDSLPRVQTRTRGSLLQG